MHKFFFIKMRTSPVTVLIELQCSVTDRQTDAYTIAKMREALYVVARKICDLSLTIYCIFLSRPKEKKLYIRIHLSADFRRTKKSAVSSATGFGLRASLYFVSKNKPLLFFE